MHSSLFRRLLTGGALGLLAALLVLLLTGVLEPRLFDAFEAKSLDWRYLGRLKTL